VFGGRPQSSASSVITNIGGVSQRVDIEEYYNLLKEKIKNNQHEIKNKFRHSDQEGRGGVSREAFGHIIASILGPAKQLSHQHYIKMLEKMGLKTRSIIRLDVF
jgi:hypothetical protein